MVILFIDILIDGDPVLFNRQPTLHRMSMMCHVVKVMRQGDTFRMNVGDTKPYNADFDGDEMNMHGPQSEEAQCELLELAAVSHQIISPANNQSIVGIFQDSLLGCYRFTRENINFDTRTAMNLLMYNNKLNLMYLKMMLLVVLIYCHKFFLLLIVNFQTNNFQVMNTIKEQQIKL